MSELFADAEVVTECPPPPILYPLFILAYWPTGAYWKICGQPFNEVGLTQEREITSLRKRGWTHVRIMRLLEPKPAGEKAL